MEADFVKDYNRLTGVLVKYKILSCQAHPTQYEIKSNIVYLPTGWVSCVVTV